MCKLYDNVYSFDILILVKMCIRFMKNEKESVLYHGLINKQCLGYGSISSRVNIIVTS